MYKGKVKTKNKVVAMTSCANLYPVDPCFTIEGMCDPVILNVQNDQRSQGLLLFSNNDKTNLLLTSAGTKECLVPPPCGTIIETKQSQQTMENSKLISNAVCMLSEPFVHKTKDDDTKPSQESPSCEDSVSETEDELDLFSSSSECLTYIEEVEKTRDGARDRGNKRIQHYTQSFKNECPARIQHSISIQTFSQPCMTLLLETSAMPKPATKEWSKTTVSEEGLSEIISPVDEVLSYGSYEFPPPAAYGIVSSSLLPPPPAFEEITWTSEEDFPPLNFPPPEIHDLYLEEDPSINSEQVSPLPDDMAPRLHKTANSGEAKNDLTMASLTAYPTLQNVFHKTQSTSWLLGEEDDTDPLFSFVIGDRVIVSLTRPGVLKYKGPAVFAGGLWAGVALDRPDGNHDGTFRGVQYFKCDRNCGVLVRAEDISYLQGEQDSDVDTGVEEDPFSDEEPPNCLQSQCAKASRVYEGAKVSGTSLEGNKVRGQNTQVDNKAYKDRQFQDKGCQNLQMSLCDEMPEGSSSSTPMPLSSLFHIGYDLCCQTTPPTMSSGFDINSWVERLTEELIKDFIMDALDIWMRKGEEGILKEGNQHSDTVKKKDDTASNKLCFIEQWQDTLCSADSGKVQVQPHDPDIVYRLVDAAVEKLMGLANSATIYIPEAPSYIIDEESVKAYGRIMYEFISEILHEVLADHFGITRSMWQTENILSSLQSSRISLTDLKVAVKSEMQKELNLEQTDLQMKERFLTLCKYRSAKRDRVDYILTQELHREELQWVDYSDDQITVKMKLTEEIFHFLLDDTISILKHICMTPFF